MAVDGTVLDIPDSKANALVFGYPVSRRGTQAAFPQLGLVLRNCCWNTFNCGCLDLSLSHWRASPSALAAAESCRRNAADVG